MPHIHWVDHIKNHKTHVVNVTGKSYIQYSLLLVLEYTQPMADNILYANKR